MARELYDDDYEDDDLPAVERASYPTMVRQAGIVWILFGCVILLNGGVSLIMQFALTAQNGPAPVGGAAISGGCGVAIILLFGLAFIMVGVQTLRGTAKDTLGNGIGSIVFGLLNLGCGGVVLSAGMVDGRSKLIVVLVTGAISLIAGLCLIAAGIVALVGRSSYLAWREGQLRQR